MTTGHMLRADYVQQAHLLPRAVSDVLSDTAARGCSQSSNGQCTYAWALHRQNLLVWKVEDGVTAAVRRLVLPEAPVGRTFVEVLPQQQSSALTVIVCTGAGQLYVWLDATFLGQPFSQQLVTSSTASSSSNVICALAASPAHAGTSPGFLAVVATSDAALHLYHGSQSGIFPRQFYHPAGGHSTRGGMLDVLGTAVKAAVRTGQIIAGYALHRGSASSMPASQLQLLQLDSGRWKLFVLTGDALDCWLLGTLSGKQSTEQLLWSYSIYQSVLGRHRAADVKVLAFTASTALVQRQLSGQAQDGAAGSTAAQEVVYVWSAHMAESAVKYQHMCSLFAVDADGAVRGPRLIVAEPLDAAAAAPRAQLDHLGWQLLANERHASCLMLSPQGVLLEWLPATGAAPRVLSSTGDNLAIACSGSSSSWQVLNKAYGVLEFSTEALRAANQQQPHAAAKALLDRVVGIMHEEFSANYPYRDLATGLSDCLSELGMLNSRDGNALLVSTSSSLVDSLPKAGTLDSNSFRAMLTDKQVRHSLLLTALQVGGVLQQLPASVLATLFEHAQVLVAAAAVLQWQFASATAAKGNDAAQQVDPAQPEASGRAIAAAGVLAAAGAGESGAAAGQEVEIFFGRPTVSMPALFQAVATQAAGIRRDAAGAAERNVGIQALLQQLLGLCKLLQTAADAADAKQQQLKQEVFNEVSKAEASGPGWLCGEGPIAAWTELAEACLLLLPLLSDLHQKQELAHDAHLPALSRLLDALRSSLRAAADPPADIWQAYQDLPWRHGQQLLHVAQEELPELRAEGELNITAEGPDDGDGVLSVLPGLSKTLVWPLQTLAQQHRCWPLLYATCEVISSIHPLLQGQLQRQMHQECAASGPTLPPHGFTRYVMQRWQSQHLVVDLLQLGREGFTPQLQQYLADCPELLWMSQVQARQYAGATGSLSKAASKASAADTQRLWCLMKLSVKAAGAKASGNAARLMATAGVQLRRLELQEQLLPGLAEPSASEALAAAALKAADQADDAAGSDQGAGGGVGLRGPDAAVAAVELLALDAANQGSESYRQLWQSSWLAVLRGTPLAELAAERAAVAQGGWQSDAYQSAVRASPLFQAFVATGAALQEAAKITPDINPGDQLEAVAAGLAAGVQDSSQQEVFADVAAAAARAVGMAF